MSINHIVTPNIMQSTLNTTMKPDPLHNLVSERLNKANSQLLVHCIIVFSRRLIMMMLIVILMMSWMLWRWWPCAGVARGLLMRGRCSRWR